MHFKTASLKSLNIVNLCEVTIMRVGLKPSEAHSLKPISTLYKHNVFFKDI